MLTLYVEGAGPVRDNLQHTHGAVGDAERDEARPLKTGSRTAYPVGAAALGGRGAQPAFEAEVMCLRGDGGDIAPVLDVKVVGHVPRGGNAVPLSTRSRHQHGAGLELERGAKPLRQGTQEVVFQPARDETHAQVVQRGGRPRAPHRFVGTTSCQRGKLSHGQGHEQKHEQGHGIAYRRDGQPVDGRNEEPVPHDDGRAPHQRPGRHAAAGRGEHDRDEKEQRNTQAQSATRTVQDAQDRDKECYQGQPGHAGTARTPRQHVGADPGVMKHFACQSRLAFVPLAWPWYRRRRHTR